MTPAVQTAVNPFPGLRSFEPEETHLFFGRDEQIDELLRRLARCRFLCVTGASASGKSSLVRAGLIPALRTGFLAVAGSRWRVALLRPGPRPIGSLALALNGVAGPDLSRLDEHTRLDLIETTLRRSSVGLLEAARELRISKGENLLIVVDQLEEIFRFKTGNPASADIAAAFVKLLVEASAEPAAPIYIVSTIRSDFLGDCAQFRDLPELLNNGQYLVPRMRRDQRRQAIEGPIAVSGARIANRLVQRLLNDMGDDPDQLPILQHAVMRTWNEWARLEQWPEAIDLTHYESIGGMSDALSRHADEVFSSLSAEDRVIAQKVFQALAEKGPDHREIRRPTSLGTLVNIVDRPERDAASVVERFRGPGNTFLTPSPDRPLTSDSIVDIAHESLIRLWGRLSSWVDEEADSAVIYVRLADAAVRHDVGLASPWRDPELQVALDWRLKTCPNAAWASRYHPAFQPAIRFLEKSERDREAFRRKRRIAAILSVGVLIALTIAAALMDLRSDIRSYYKHDADKAAAVIQLTAILVNRSAREEPSVPPLVRLQLDSSLSRDLVELVASTRDVTAIVLCDPSNKVVASSRLSSVGLSCKASPDFSTISEKNWFALLQAMVADTGFYEVAQILDIPGGPLSVHVVLHSSLIRAELRPVIDRALLLSAVSVCGAVLVGLAFSRVIARLLSRS